MKLDKPCEVCDRRAGYAPFNRFGEPDLCPDTPLGEVALCPECGRYSCPDCQHERECCELALAPDEERF